VVDDDESVRVAVASLLRSVGFVVLLFPSAEEFLREDIRSIGCLILDLRMPGMDGLELQAYLRANGCRIPTIFLTALRNDAGRAQALTAGAIAFLTKPFDAEVLLRAVQSGVQAA
jgi:FixJ family two-component response regulator